MTILNASKLLKELTPISLEINVFAQIMHANFELDPISLNIILSSDVYLKPFIFVLAVTRLRFKDAKHLFKSSAFLQSSVVIQQSKTKHFTLVDLSPIPYHLRFSLFQLNHYAEISDYHKIYSFLRFYKRNYLKTLTLDFNSNAHIFRHLHASFLHFLKKGKNIIKNDLGHLDNISQSSYIHEELVSLFSQLT
jgi:hypothetical protein